MKSFITLVLLAVLGLGGYYAYRTSTGADESEDYPIAYTCRDGGEFEVLSKSTTTIRIRVGAEKVINLTRPNALLNDFKNGEYQALFTGDSGTVKKNGVTLFGLCSISEDTRAE